MSDPNPPPGTGATPPRSSVANNPAQPSGGAPPAVFAAAHSSREGFSRDNFSQDFRRFFLRGLAALLPTLITLWLLMKVWEFLWQSIGIYLIFGLKRLASATAHFSTSAWVANRPELSVDPRTFPWHVQVAGVLLSVVLVYLVGLFVGHIIGRTAWRLIERAVMRVPLIRAIYPAVKQVTDFVLADKSTHFLASRVVAVEPHAKGIWSIGLVTGSGIKPLSESVGMEMITVFIPSSPTAFTGYVLVVPRDSVIELPLTVEQAMRLLVSGGVIDPESMARRPQVRLEDRPEVLPQRSQQERLRGNSTAGSLPIPTGEVAAEQRSLPRAAG